MIQREILAKLQEWKDSEYRKPLILRGHVKWEKRLWSMN